MNRFQFPHRGIATAAPWCLLARWFLPAWLLLLLIPQPGLGIERRKPQFLTETAYLFVPFPYSLAGIGEGIIFTGLVSNIAGSNIDASAFVVTGDVEGTFFLVQDIHLISETLILEGSRQAIDKLVLNSYGKRGMGTRKDDFTLLELNQLDASSARLTLTLFDRRLEFFGGGESSKSELTRVHDSEGLELFKFDPPIKSKSERTFLGALLDYTDDRQDPRVGLRVGAQTSQSPPTTLDDPDFSVRDVFITGYIPIGSLNTLALHYFQSDAVVDRPGLIDPNQIGLDNFGCLYATTCSVEQKNTIDTFVAENRYGTSTSLGGLERLRSFPLGRFQGAHTVFYAVEFRWNLTEEATPFDYFIWKDVRTGVQVAFFAETGSVADTKAEVGNTFASSYGVGFRLVSGSGNVYRADIATGDEGAEVTVIFTYPWGPS